MSVREVIFTKQPNEPNDALVKMLEEWLERAKKGEIVACGIAGVKPDGVISTNWTGLGGGWLHQMNSAIVILQYRILTTNIAPE